MGSFRVYRSHLRCLLNTSMLNDVALAAFIFLPRREDIVVADTALCEYLGVFGNKHLLKYLSPEALNKSAIAFIPLHSCPAKYWALAVLRRFNLVGVINVYDSLQGILLPANCQPVFSATLNSLRDWLMIYLHLRHT